MYEEYGAKYEMMIKDIANAYRTIPQWETYQKGLEALASSLASINSQHDNARKALTIGDLLVKVNCVSSCSGICLRMLANPTCMQVPSAVLGTVKTDSCL